MRRWILIVALVGGAVFVFSCGDLDELPDRDAADEKILGEEDITIITAGCFDQQLPWDSKTQVSECHFLLGFKDMETCPFETESAGPYFSEDGTMLYCPVPRIPTTLDCHEIDSEVYETEALGWFYCESFAEDFDYNCSDGLDNDSDGYTDCDDEPCELCPSCGGDGCYSSCPWMVGESYGLEQYAYNNADRRCVYCPGGIESN